MGTFSLNPRLRADTAFIADLALSRALLMDDARYAWVVLVPRRAGAVEIFDLDASDRTLLVEEIARVARVLKDAARATKINIGALGNLVPQLHVHVVARRPGDPAWPGPVWGQGAAEPYSAGARDDFAANLRHMLGL